ncbi:putative Ig domain-containing protein [bacterium]|nr:putative Ig domain-containing protein [bacterium]
MMRHYIHPRRIVGTRLLWIAAILILASALHCLQTVPSETGELQLTLTWNQPPQPDDPSAGKTATADIQSVTVTADPGAVTESFFSWDSALSIDLALGIYNISVRARDSREQTLYEGEAEKILVQPLETTVLTIAMNSLFPTEAPEFIGLADTTFSSDGNYQLLWSSCACADTYVLEESGDNSFASAAQIYSGPDTAFAVTGREEGTWYYRVRGENDIAASAWSEPALFIVVNVPLLTITADTLTGAEPGSPYADSVTVSGGTPPYTWSVTAGSLPFGLTLDGATGIISGTPTAVDEWTFTVSVSDAGPPVQTVSREYSINVEPAPLHITTDSPLPEGSRNIAYSQNITAEGGSTDWSWELTEGNLPAGLDFLDLTETGLIQGTPTETGTFIFTVTVSDVIYPWLSDAKQFSLTISGAPALFISTGSLPDGRADQSYSTTLQAAGGTPPFVWSEDTRTAGFAENIALSSGGVLSGMPNPQPESGTITFRVTDSGSPAQSVTRTLGLTFDPGTLTLLQAYLPEGTADTDYDGYILYKYGTGPLETPWTISGDWPEDVVISYGADNYQMSITGHPTEGGTYNFSITVRDSGSPQQTRTDSFTITIN